jgi:hypothetical protein
MINLLMKRSAGFIVLLTTLFTFGLAQNTFAKNRDEQTDKGDKKAKIEELRKKYFNEKLALSETEQKAFWPLYKEYKEKEKALRDSFRAKYKPNDVIFMDDKQAEAFLNASIKLNEDQNNLFKEYVERFKKVISVKKVAMLPMVEREFKREILKKAREHHRPDDQNPPPPPKEEEED